jgi:hypothetical protein
VEKLMLVGLIYSAAFILANHQVWDFKPSDDSPINWVELKTSVDIRNERDTVTFERKLMKFWIQSFLLGVPKIIVGFRTPDGFLTKIEELETASIPNTVKRQGRGTWDGNMCINFASSLLECMYDLIFCSIAALMPHRPERDGEGRRCLPNSTKGAIPCD